MSLCRFFIDEQRDKKFFRKDYTFLEATNTFYKIHTIQRSWADAKKICKLEGASFYYAENDDEAKVVLDFWHQTQPLPRVWVGISDLVAKGVFETYDGTFGFNLLVVTYL